ncbi:E1-E2 ATPase-domain-containing protein [Lactarius akahatsu]|uniref:E1-E2 ATPase-domain-containing protein n=1 Tax=Lactarius akahatsu TaxID=416441 RepID=A0AAD4QAG8_9AGAM|nr:E1-E2 ATPase-domain-containing protein [Lactarius akahatsu]
MAISSMRDTSSEWDQTEEERSFSNKDGMELPVYVLESERVLLSIATVVLLALGLFQDFGTPRPAGDPPVDWVEGVAIITAILGSLNDWQKERRFQVLNEKKEDRLVKVIRDGGERQIDVHEVVVGDVVLLESGEVIPCDGVFLSGHNVNGMELPVYVLEIRDFVVANARSRVVRDTRDYERRTDGRKAKVTFLLSLALVASSACTVLGQVSR